MALLRVRPVRLRRVCWVSAAAVLAVFIALAVALPGGSSLRAGDRSAMVGVGVIVALAILALARPLVEADERHIHVRNIVGSYDLTWDLVRAIRFSKGSPWASLDLADDERISVMAVQSVDKQYALEAMTGLRNLLAQSRQSRD